MTGIRHCEKHGRSQAPPTGRAEGRRIQEHQAGRHRSLINLTSRGQNHNGSASIFMMQAGHKLQKISEKAILVEIIDNIRIIFGKEVNKHGNNYKLHRKASLKF